MITITDILAGAGGSSTAVASANVTPTNEWRDGDPMFEVQP